MVTVSRPPVQRTSVGKKLLMAWSSVILFGYVVVHLIGNLKVFTGPDPFNHYAEWLRTAGDPIFPEEGLLWTVRILLLVAIVVHVGAYVALWRKTRRARGVRYRKYDPQVFSYASRTMAWGGIAILAFVIFHLLHMTTGTVHSDFIIGDPYHNVLADFRNIWISGFYAIGVVALGLHLYHGLWSAMQTLGFNNPKYNRYRRPMALATAVVITLGYLSIPFAVLTGIVS